MEGAQRHLVAPHHRLPGPMSLALLIGAAVALSPADTEQASGAGDDRRGVRRHHRARQRGDCGATSRHRHRDGHHGEARRHADRAQRVTGRLGRGVSRQGALRGAHDRTRSARSKAKWRCVWGPYTFAIDGTVRHCGFQHFDLVREDGAGRSRTSPGPSETMRLLTRMHGRYASVDLAPHRQSRRDRLPDHPHRARDGHPHGRGLFGCRRQRAARPAGRRGSAYRPVAGARKLSGRRQDHRRRQGNRAPRRSIPATASSPRMPISRRR